MSIVLFYWFCSPYRMGLLKITKMTNAIKEFVVSTYSRYKAEGE